MVRGRGGAKLRIGHLDVAAGVEHHRAGVEVTVAEREEIVVPERVAEVARLRGGGV